MALNYGDEYDPTRYDADLPEQGATPGAAPSPTATDPGATNPNATTPTFTPVADALPIGGMTQDPNVIKAWIAKWAAMPDADPSLGADPDYWVKAILARGGLGHSNTDYWMKAGVGPTAFFRNPGREGTDLPGGNLSGDTRQYNDDWFSQNTPAPATYNALARPEYLQGAYKPQQWTEKFEAPSLADLEATPGYQARLGAAQKASERSAAAKGSILSGGFQTALGREQQNIASQEYGNVFGRAYDTYQQRYGQFRDQENANLGARGLNEATYQGDVAQNLNTYNTRYKGYRDTISDQFDLARLGLDAALGARY